MAEDRNNSQGFIGQAHTREHGSPPPPAPVAALAAVAAAAVGTGVAALGVVQRDDSPPRGPRTLLLRRGENGFGFTLRHFIVYPPESCCMLPGHERTRIEEPMDTIFVKQVRGNSPAAEAGLRTGDRVVSVDGKPTRGEQYAKVVQRIQQAGPWLRLLVVSKEDDILQRYFGETAHNPETNQRPRLRSPDRSSQRQRRSVSSMIPGLSPRTRQSWVCSAPTSMPISTLEIESDRPMDDGLVLYRDQEIRFNEFSKENQQPSRSNDKTQSTILATTTATTTATRTTMHRCKPFPEIAGRYESVDEKVKSQDRHQSAKEGPNSIGVQSCEKYDVYDRMRPDSIYSRDNSEEIYDRIKDPIYERVRLGEPARTSAEERQHQQYYQALEQQPSLTRYPLSRAEPQVPIYRPSTRRVTSRRASEGSTASSTINNNLEASSYASTDALRSCDPGASRFSIDSKRDSSPIRPGDPPSYDSISIRLGNGANDGYRNDGRYGSLNETRNTSCNGDGSPIIDDSIIMTRLRKSFEQKEEFLRRPSHPIGWFLPEEKLESPIRNSGSAAIPREFYARPQKLREQIWPPNDPRQDQQSLIPRTARDKNFTTNHLALDISSSSNQSAQRLKTDAAVEAEYPESRNNQTDETLNAARSLEDTRRQQQQQQATADRPCSSSVYDHLLDGSDAKEADRHQQQLYRNTCKSSFVGTLSRIHENITSTAVLLSNERQQSQDTRNGASSLPSSPGPEKKVNDKFSALPQGLRVVSKRAKQFESGRLLSDDDDEPTTTGDRTSLYKSELSRLSHKRSVPNVAVRKREFESKAEAQEPRRAPVATRETKSLDSGNGLKGNRIIPVGSRRIHCEPPAGYKPIEGTPSPRTTRIRSNSTESWESTSGNSQTGRHEWSQQDDAERARNANETTSNNSTYIDATSSASDDKNIRRGSSRGHDGYAQSIEAERGGITDNGAHSNGVVFRRQKNAQVADEDRATRRVSYLKATWGERMHVDSDLELSDSEPVHASRSIHKRWRLPLFANDIASLRRIFEDVTQSTSLNRNVYRSNTCTGRGATGIVKDIEQVEREGPLHVKFTVLDGKRSSDRSWKQVWGVLRGPILFFYKDRQNQSLSLANDGESVTQNVDVRCSLVDIAEDYTKRKHVLRLANPSAEVLLQTEDAASMALWLRALHEHAAAEKPSEISYNSTLKQQAVPQTPGPTTSLATHQTIGGVGTVAVSSSGGQRLSPLPGHKGIKKLTSFRNRSPTGQSPINKTRKPSQTIETLVSPKTKTWKGRVAKQLRRMHGQTGSPSSPTTQLPPEGATFKVPLELCPSSSFSEYVPLIVEMCTSIVEARGLEVVGIYRVPGNTAAISHLTDSVNKGFENINLQDPRWSDVNVISSLLKSFFRQLPDSLLTAELYPMFIDADKVEDPQRRMTTIRKLLRDLPEHHFETLKYLMLHLKRIVEHSEVNKMEAKNLAIVFGPTLVRASGSRDNMVTMVTDMSHQCRIVESLLNNVDWFFSDDDLDDLSRLSVNLSLPADNSEIDPTASNNHSLLLNNIQKVEGVREMASAKDIVSSIISAANRKIQRRRKGQDETDNESHHETDKYKAKQEAESMSNRRSMALNERQCSVSEIVLMHENKNQSGRSADRSDRSSPIDAAVIGGVTTAGNGGIVGDSVGDNTGDTISSNNSILSDRSKNNYLNPPAGELIQSIQPIQPIHRSTVSSASESSRLSSETGLSCFDASSTLSSASNDTKQSNDEVTIRTYAGLSATTQERIRRFEQETKAMLQRDQNRQRREAEKREEERRRIEMEWQLAKREMENDDLLDSIVDTTMTPTYLSSAARLATLNDRITDKSILDIGSRTTARIPPLSIAVQQQPTIVRRVSQLSDEPSTILPPETVANTIIKKLKTDQEPVLESSTLVPVHCGSLDSLHEAQDVSQSSLSPSQQQRKPLYSDVSDDGSDLLTSLTTTFDRKWRSLVNSSHQTGRGSAAENTSFSDEEIASARDSQSLRNLRGLREERDERKIVAAVQSTDCCSIEAYRDPSLHKSSLEKPQNVRQKDDAPEKDTDSSVTENSSIDRLDAYVPDNDRSAIVRRRIESKQDQLRSSKEEIGPNLESSETQECYVTQNGRAAATNDANYSNKLEKFESLTNFEVRSRLKRSESLNKRSENTSSKLKRSESLNKHSVERLSSPTSGKLKRSESLNKHSERSDSPNSKLKRSESLTKTEKTECNISKRRQSVRKDSATKLKRKNGMPERSIKRRHTVGGTKDFDKVHWLDNKLQAETADRVVRNECRPKKSQLRTSSPDLSTGRIGLTDASFLIEVSFRGPSNVVFNVTNARPQSLPDTSLASKVFKPIVRRLYGADRLVALSTAPVFHENTVQCAEQSLNYVLLLKNLLDVVPELEAALSAGESEILGKIRKNLENPRFRLMRERILHTIHPDARSVTGYTSSNMQRCFAIKAGINDLLDIARQTYCELIDDMKSMVENLASKYKLTLSLACNASLGYHVQAIFPRNWNAEAFDPPAEFIEVRKSKRVYTMTTSTLATLSQQCKIASEELHLMSNVLLNDLQQNLREYISCLFQLSSDVAELDLLISLARVSSLQTYVKPIFGRKLELLDSRHPVLEAFGLDSPVPNNVSASVYWNFHVITGPNMSGKSTYLKQIVLLHIMAQIGCFVPAKKATFRITDLIFCKIAVRDDIECNASTFTLEMKEAQYVLRSVTSTSLIVLDELCKGTAIDEGASIAWAICERLSNTTAFVFAATHFVGLTKLADVYCNVKNHYMETISLRGKETDDFHRLTYTHRVKHGVAPIDDYGIVLAQLAGLPDLVTEKARRYASDRLLTVDPVTTKSNDSEIMCCYDIVIRMYELLKMEKFYRDRVTNLLECIGKVEAQKPGKETAEEANNGKKKKIHVEEKKKDGGANDSLTDNEIVCSKGTFDATKLNILETKADFEEIPDSSTTTISYNNIPSPTEPLQKQSSIRNFDGGSFDLNPYRSIITSFNSSSVDSMVTENNLSGLERQPSASNNLNICSMASPGTVLSFPLAHELSSPMQMSITTERSAPTLYEYCLSDDDFEPS
ncbi:rho GTPase activating protein at 19D isoform X2 [Andrena cerasifolii]